METVRLDKWLWAARFFKTRSLAKKAVDGGKVHMNGQACRVSQQVRVGDELVVRQGFDEKTIVVKALSEVRGPAASAALLYDETDESKKRREQVAQVRKMAGAVAAPKGRPTKKDRRKIIRFLSDL